MVDLNKIIQAKRTISGFVDETPFAVSNELSKNYNANVFLKEENLQKTGAYKILALNNIIKNYAKFL